MLLRLHRTVATLALWILLLQVCHAAEIATLVVYRPTAFAGWVTTTLVTIDGKTAAALRSCNYVKLPIAYGVHAIEVVHKPLVGDTSPKVSLKHDVFVPAGGTSYVGYYLTEMSSAELKSTFTAFVERKGRSPSYLGSVHESVATLALVDCSRLGSVLN